MKSSGDGLVSGSGYALKFKRGLAARMAGRAAVAVGLAACAALFVASAHAADLCNNTNTGGVLNNPSSHRTPCNLGQPAHITQLVTYHWNNGMGARPGTILLFSPNTGNQWGPFPASGSSGQGGKANVNWTANVNISVPAGLYQVIDSDPSTWSWNSTSGGYGFAIVSGNYTFGGKYTYSAPTPTPVRRLILPQPSPTPRTLPNPMPPPPSPATLPLPNPCHANSATYLELAKPVCSGPPGTTLTLYVSRAGLKMRPTAAIFKRGPIGQMLFANVNLPYGPALFQQPLTLTRGDGLMPGSLYTVAIPAGACLTGRNHMWAFDIEIPNGGDIDVVSVQC
ncbi:MAG: hypothetical protein KGM97_08395 [Alphaproteobacteria bacterium]|nr:hypothetical protein [Alphaproteobacteria bacterium]MDE2630994.1 hypothetical protein [Alphaproteobacteria bacterium]